MLKNTMEGLKEDRKEFEEKHPKLVKAGKWVCRGLVAAGAIIGGAVAYKAITDKSDDEEVVDLGEVDAIDSNESGDDDESYDSTGTEE